MDRVATAVSFSATYLVVLLTFTPRLLLRRTLATGGDMGSHHYVSRAAEQFLPWSLGGWATGWYAGMPVLEFYFPAPYVLIWLVTHVTGYEVAFKLITVFGIFLLPVASWFLFRMLDAPPLARAVAPFGAVAFLWIEGRAGPPDTSQLNIFGGFITSTMAGEFGYSIALSFVLVCLGLLYRATRRCAGTLPWGLIALTSLLIGITTITHLIPVTVLGFAAPVLVIGAVRRDRPALWGGLAAAVPTLVVGLVLMTTKGVWSGPWYAIVGWLFALLVLASTVMLWVAGFDWRRLAAVGVVAALGFGVAAFWFLPFWVLHEFTAPSEWTNVTGAAYVLPLRFVPVLVLAAAAVAVAIWRRRPGPLVLAWTGAVAVVVFELVPTGPMVNGRVLPVWYLMMCLVAVWGAGEVFDWVPLRGNLRWVSAALAVAVAGAIAATSVLPSQNNRPGGPTWATHNYSGYEVQPGWEELQKLMASIQDLPPGRVAWEYNDDYERFGTPRALENIPFFTDKDTMEGLLVEGSVSALPHFWLQGLFSPAATGAVPGPQYPAFDTENATRLLEIFGVEWFVAETPSVVSGFRETPGVTEYGSSGERFTIFEIEDASLVYVPEYEPVRLNEEVLAGMPDWRTDVVLPWLEDPSAWDVPLTLGALGFGAPGDDSALDDLSEVDSVEELDSAPRRPTSDPGAVESRLERTRITFETEAVGQPHVVAVSYFPNWHAEGAEGPYFLTPSLMLVYPTQERVTITYEPNPIERLGGIVSLVSLLAIAALGVVGVRRRRGRHDGEAGIEAGVEVSGDDALWGSRGGGRHDVEAVAPVSFDPP